eukprot:3066056-Alexandrium_andersonii.AAC.1
MISCRSSGANSRPKGSQLLVEARSVRVGDVRPRASPSWASKGLPSALFGHRGALRAVAMSFSAEDGADSR